MRLAIVGAGPGDPELITLKGRRLLGEADLVIYAGSLVNPALLEFRRPDAKVYDSAAMTLEEVLAIYDENAGREGLIVRLHTGDPSLYGAIQEQIDHCLARGMEVEVVPGVSSVFAAAAALKRELTLPGLGQTLILTRAAGRSSVPERESLSRLASHGATMAIFLSAGLLPELLRDLIPHYGPDCPLRMVHRASWPDERIVRTSLGEMEARLALPGGSPWAENSTEDSGGTGSISGGPTGQVMILVGPVLGAAPADYEKSKLYDPGFSHGRRKGRKA